jgi:hypothetical protein
MESVVTHRVAVRWIAWLGASDSLDFLTKLLKARVAKLASGNDMCGCRSVVDENVIGSKGYIKERTPRVRTPRLSGVLGKAIWNVIYTSAVSPDRHCPVAIGFSS